MSEAQPFFSIVVPTYERPRQLTSCLESLAALDYPCNRFEVIVVDDGGGTGLEEVVCPFRDGLELTLITQQHAGPAAARNTGAAQARGQVLAFTDDDCRPAADWLQKLAARFAAAPDCAVAGRTINTLPDNPYATASQLLIDGLHAYYNADPNRACFATSNNLAFPADRFQAIGGFDRTFPYAAAEDRDLCDRWLHHGYRMVYASEVVVYHAHALTLRTFWRQHFNYGRGAFRFHTKRAQRGQGHLRPEPAFYLNLVRYPFSQMGGVRALRFACLLLMAQVANASGFFRSALRPGQRE